MLVWDLERSLLREVSKESQVGRTQFSNMDHKFMAKFMPLSS